MRCTVCSSENPEGFAFCGHCGSPLPRPCPECGLGNPHDSIYCGYCGAELPRLPSSIQLQPEGERRFVVILFVDIAGYTRIAERLDAEEAAALVNECLDQMTQVVMQHGGRVDKYIGDGVMVVFGAPTAREDDPERALLTARALQETMSKLELHPAVPHVSLHVGAACGQVVAARVGAKARREYTVIGLTVNLAKRLEEVSEPGQILVSQELAQLTKDKFSFRPVSFAQFHGWEGGMEAFELTGVRSEDASTRHAGQLQSPLVGREEEIALLGHSLHKLAQGKGGIIFLIGEAGTGKTRLLREARAQSQEQGLGIFWLEGSADIGEPVQYGHWRTLLRNAVGEVEHASAIGTAGRLQAYLSQWMPDEAQKVSPFLARVMGGQAEQETCTRLEGLDGESLKWQTFQAMRAWVLALAQHNPLVLALEDMHVMDSTSTELLEQMLALVGQAPLLIVGACRPEPTCPAYHLREVAQSKYRDVYTELGLRFLPASATSQMANHLLGNGQVSQPALDVIQRLTEGNPLFIEVVVRSMADQALLTQQADAVWEFAPGMVMDNIPYTIQSILQARLDRLDGEAIRILQLAACIGQRFPHRILEATCDSIGVRSQRLDPGLKTLEEAALIEREAKSHARAYTFKSSLIRDTVHGNLMKGTRSQFHRAIAQWYETSTLQAHEPPHAVLAYHYEQIGDNEKRKFYLIQAGRQTAKSYANQEACVFFTQALALSQSPAERFELLLAREQVLDLMGLRDQQHADLEELLKLADQQDNSTWQATVYYRFALWHASQGDYSAALTAAQEGQAAAHRASDARVEADNLHQIASATWRQGRFAEALEAVQAAIHLARESGDATREATSLTTMGVIYRSMRDLASARVCYQHALDIHRASGDKRGEAINLTQLGNVLYDQGDFTGALDYHQHGLELFRQVGDRRGQAWSLSGLGTVYQHCGEYTSARTCHEQALALRRDVGDQRGVAVSLADLGNVLVGLGELPVAQAQLEQALALSRSLGARRDEVYIVTYLAQAREEAGDLDAAQAMHEAAIKSRIEQGQQAASVENVAGLARLALKQNDLETAIKHAAQVLRHIREHDLAYIESPLLVYLTCIHVLAAQGQDRLARHMLAEAYGKLLKRADKITDTELRRSFLERVPEHRQIIAAWMAGRQ